MKKILILLYLTLGIVSYSNWTNYKPIIFEKQTDNIDAITFNLDGDSKGTMEIVERYYFDDVKATSLEISPEISEYDLYQMEKGKQKGDTINLYIKIDDNKIFEYVGKSYLKYYDGSVSLLLITPDKKMNNVDELIDQMKKGKEVFVEIERVEKRNGKIRNIPYYSASFYLDGFEKAYNNVKVEGLGYDNIEFYDNGRIKSYSDGPIEMYYEDTPIDFKALNEQYEDVKNIVEESIKNGDKNYIWQLQEGIEPQVFGLLLSKNLTIKERMKLSILQDKIEELQKKMENFQKN